MTNIAAQETMEGGTLNRINLKESEQPVPTSEKSSLFQNKTKERKKNSKGIMSVYH